MWISEPTPVISSTISRTINVSSILAPHRADVVDVGRSLRTENTDEECQPDGDLGSGDGDDEEGHNLPVDVSPLPCKGDQREVSRVQHELDGHEDDHHVPPGQHPDSADGEQDSTQEHVICRRDHSLSPISVAAILYTKNLAIVAYDQADHTEHAPAHPSYVCLTLLSCGLLSGVRLLSVSTTAPSSATSS